MTIDEKIINIISYFTSLGTDNIKQSDELEMLGLDSLDLVELVMELEEEFMVEITDEMGAKFLRVEDVTYRVKQLLGDR